MTHLDLITRRNFGLALLGLAGAAVTSTACARAIEQMCAITPRQTEGPYYPPRRQLEAMLDQDNDLTKVGGKAERAKGQIIYVMGQVQDGECRPVEGARLEIWQASENGRYHHPRDEGNPAPLDPNFQYWGTHTAREDGRYLFKTIKPGAYQAGPGWIRPPHIHFKITHPSSHELITQMYFAGDPYQAKDFILNKIPEAERDRVIVMMEKPGADYEAEARMCRFDVTLPS